MQSLFSIGSSAILFTAMLSLLVVKS